MHSRRSGDRGIRVETLFSLAFKQPTKQLPDSDTFCGFHGRNISTYRESLVPGIPTLEHQCIMHAYEIARTHRSRTRTRGIGAKGGRKVTAPWEYLDLRETEGAGRGAGRRAEATRRS